MYISYCSKRNFHLTTHTGSCPSVGRLVGPLLVCHLYWSGSYTSMLLWAELRSHPIFGGSGSGSHPSKIKRLRLRLRLLVNCKAENYEFVTTKKKYFLPWYKITEFTCSTLGTTGQNRNIHTYRQFTQTRPRLGSTKKNILIFFSPQKLFK